MRRTDRMLTDARSLPVDHVIESDVCVIGGGAAGITLALELRGSGLRTVVVESGGRTGPDEATQDLYAGTSIGRPVGNLVRELSLDTIRLRWLGGTTNHWAGFCRPLEAIDFEPREHLDVSGWPLTRDDLVPYWRRAAQWCRITDDVDGADEWSQRSDIGPALLDTEVIRTTTFQITPFMWFGEIYQPDLEQADDVDVVLWANVVNLATGDGRRVDAVDVRTLSGNRLTVQARAYVLACGGLENPRILLASTDADPAGLGNRTDQVGRHFAEHLQVPGGFGVIDIDRADLEGFVGTETVISEGRFAGETHGLKHALTLTSDHVRAAETLGLEAQLIPGSPPLGVPTQLAGIDVDATAELVALTAGHTPPSSIYVQLLAEQALDPESRVTLGSEVDPLGMRRIVLDWRYGRKDRAALVGGMRTMAEHLGAMGLGRLQILPGGISFDGVADPDEFITIYKVDLDAVDVDEFPISVGFHHMCTTRMSADAATGVVDSSCRVHEVDNLWIGGSSVFGTSGVATPTFTIVALAIRLADHLKQLLA